MERHSNEHDILYFYKNTADFIPKKLYFKLTTSLFSILDSKLQH